MSLDDILENCCAPFLMGLRPACMFVAPWDCKGEIRETFYDTNVQIMPMGQIGAEKLFATMLHSGMDINSIIMQKG